MLLKIKIVPDPQTGPYVFAQAPQFLGSGFSQTPGFSTYRSLFFEVHLFCIKMHKFPYVCALEPQTGSRTFKRVQSLLL